MLDLSKRGFDVFLNLCDGAWDEDRPGIEVVQVLERLQVPFTGASSPFYEPSRLTMKRICHYADIHSPAYAFASDPGGVEVAAASLALSDDREASVRVREHRHHQAIARGNAGRAARRKRRRPWMLSATR